MIERESDTYRRGLTLGLTMAEIFILILFLLLLVLLALYAVNAETKEELEQAQKELTATENDLEVMRSQLPKKIEVLERRVVWLEKALVIAKKENTINEALLEESEEELEAEKESHEKIQTELAKTESMLEQERGKLPKNLQTLIRKIKSVEEALADAEKENTDLKARLENIQLVIDQLRAELYAAKGVDPPCWYKVVHRQEKRHEKPYYLLDIAVHDEHLRIRVNDNIPLPGRAIDENGQPASTSYEEEYAKLSLARLATIRKVSLVEFEGIAEPIKHMGKNKQIRNYACVFYVKIWDFTSATAKKRWKRSRGEIENFFYPLLILNDPWPYTDVAN